MAPATIAGATLRSRAGRRGGWSRDEIINAIQEWVATYGEPPRAADWNPSSARWAAQLWRVERYRAGRADGTAWPALNTAKRPFGGSLTAAIVAAGFAPAKPGPKRRRDVDIEQADRALISPEGRAMIAAALAQARAAQRRVSVLERRLERVAQRRTQPVAAKPKVIRERVVDDAALARAQRRVDAMQATAEAAVRDSRGQVGEARMDAAEARGAAKRMAARLERAEASIASLRDERRELRVDLDRTTDRLTAVQRMLDALRADGTRPPMPVAARDGAPTAAQLRSAVAEAAAERRVAEAAQLRAAQAERELRETVAAIRGEARRLTTAELAELRTDGPSGPAVMAGALQVLATARASANPTAMRDALARVAQAAVTWQERI